MVVRAPGFAPAWEAAKAEATEEIAQEEIGKSSPKRFFNRLFGNAALKLLDSSSSADSSSEAYSAGSSAGTSQNNTTPANNGGTQEPTNNFTGKP